jgi:hypothetical protein
MISRVPSVCRGGNAVRVPPRAQCFRSSAAFSASECAQIVLSGPLRGPFLLAGAVAGRLSPSLPGSTVCPSLPVHGRPGLGHHDRDKDVWVSSLPRCLLTGVLLLYSLCLSCMFMVDPGEGNMTCAYLQGIGAPDTHQRPGTGSGAAAESTWLRMGPMKPTAFLPWLEGLSSMPADGYLRRRPHDGMVRRGSAR